MNRQDAIRFLRRFSMRESTSAEEQKAFLAWLHQQEEGVVKEIAGEYESIVHQRAFLEPVDELLASKIESRLDALSGTESGARVRKLTHWLRYAAAVILIGGGGLFFWMFQKTRMPQTAKSSWTHAAGDILPGGNKAVLTLADGSTIVLDSVANGNLADQGSTRILKLNTGILAYKSEKGAAIGFNTITTPRGGQYQIILPDGSGVWLNAASSLRFPTAFTGNKRTVEINGEAYLEVKKITGQPFTVIASGTEIQVLGTSFNVNAYDDEPLIKVALAEGSVQVKQGTETALLKPGQMGMVYRDPSSENKSGIRVQAANIPDVMAWKNGLFVFNEASIEVIMRQLARWYNLDIAYKGKVRTTFLATIPKNVPLSHVLEALEFTNAVQFKTEGKHITVMP